MKIFYSKFENSTRIKAAFILKENYLTQLRLDHDYYNGHKVDFLEESEKQVDVGDCEDMLRIINNIDSENSITNSPEKYKNINESKYLPGEYHPRIYRPILQNLGYTLKDFGRSSFRGIGKKKMRKRNPKPSKSDQVPLIRPIDRSVVASIVNQTEILSNELLTIFQTVHPAKENMHAFGYRIRNLLIISCTEIEAQLKGILEANEKEPIGKYYSTKDYVQLIDVLKLRDYELQLIQYPGLNSICPFSHWDLNNPTLSLSWYNDYNAVKHDREKEFSKSTLNNLIYSIGGLIILCEAQLGTDNEYMRTRVATIFNFIRRPKWSDKEFYWPPILDSYEWKPKNILL